MKMIGLSLSSCIRDLCLFRAPQASILAIVAGTAFEKPDWKQEAIDCYGKTIWKDLDMSDIQYYLDTLPIIQPRLFGHMPPSVAHGHWIVIGDDLSTNIRIQHWES
jgi:hypothetical protein